MTQTGLHPYWIPLQQAFAAHANEQVAKGASAYMKNISVFYGIKSPERRMLQQQFTKTYGLPEIHMLEELVQHAWNQPQREFQYAAMEVVFKLKKQFAPNHILLFEFMILNKSWWDTIDFIAPNLVAEWFRKFPNERDRVISKWMLSGNIWLQRSCLLFQLKYKQQTDQTLLFSLTERLSGEKEFFIRKAIGWALREYAKVNPDPVKSFVDTTPLSGLSRREALKHFR
jgi:3-methyladenine DNA glycosylase AlkD